jgi:hypothetical protein
MKSNNPPTTSAQEGAKSDPDLLDSVFDNVCPVPVLKKSDSCGEIGTTEPQPGTKDKGFTMFNKKSSTVSDNEAVDKNENDLNMDTNINNDNEADVVAVTDDNAEASALEKLAAKFDVNCCAKNSSKQDEDAEVPVDLEDGKDKADDRSLTEIAAKMNNIDLESQNTENDDSLDHDVTKQQVAPFYKEPFYAALIVLCGMFTIAIIVMSVLVAKK